MKGKMRKLFALALAAIMVLAMGITASAQTVGTKTDGTATITINNASKGETYKVYKLFDASVTGTENGSIAYTGDIPEGLAAYFTKDSAGNISATEAAGTNGATSEELQTALTEWTKTATVVANETSDGSILEFAGLAYGYYVVTTSQGSGALTVTSTNPNASIYDKNTTVPTVDPNEGKKVDNDNVYIGQTVTYTLKFTTSNYEGSGESAKKIISYTVNDTLPDWLTDVEVTAITIKGAGENGADLDYKVNDATPQFEDKAITIPWTNTESGASLYKNGTEVVVTYTAKVASNAAIAGNGNSNTFTLTYHVENDETPKTPDSSTSTEVIKTYALVIQKVDQNGNALAGATFSVAGLQTTGSAGNYTVTGMTAQGGTDTVMDTDGNGILVIKGVASGNYSVTEVEAPDGYNKLEGTVSIEATETAETTTEKTTYLNADGTVSNEETQISVVYKNDDLAASVLPIVNKTGSMLPSTGGIGTTIFYVVGGILVVAAGVLLITKKRMSKEQ